MSNVVGRPYQDIVESEIIRPLGLAHTTFREPYPARADLPAPMPASLAGAVSTGYRWAGGSFRPQTFEYATQVAPAAALSSTAGDMARYMEMILAGGQLDGATLYDADTAAGFRTTLQSAAPGVNGLDNGFMEFALPGGFRGQGHNGDTLWFHSSLITVPALGLGIFVATNTDTGDRLAGELPKRIVAQFYASAAGIAPPRRAGAAGRSGDLCRDLSERSPGLRRPGKVRADAGRRGQGQGDQGWPAADLWRSRRRPGPGFPMGRPATSRKPPDRRRWPSRSTTGAPCAGSRPPGRTAYERIGLLERLGTLELFAALAALASVVTLAGHFFRDRQIRQTPLQGRASLIQSTIAVLWLIAMVRGGVWGLGTGDMGKVMYQLPSPLLLIASACALVAALLTLLTVGMSPSVWRGGRRVDSWGECRKLRFTATTAVFAAFAFMLPWWGALEPWSG